MAAPAPRPTPCTTPWSARMSPAPTPAPSPCSRDRIAPAAAGRRRARPASPYGHPRSRRLLPLQLLSSPVCDLLVHTVGDSVAVGEGLRVRVGRDLQGDVDIA